MASSRPPRTPTETIPAARRPDQPPREPHHERLIFRLALVAGFPGVVVSMVLLWRGDFSTSVRWTLGILVVGTWLALAIVLRERVVRPLQTLSNMLAALREGDYS